MTSLEFREGEGNSLIKRSSIWEIAVNLDSFNGCGRFS